MTDLEKVSLRLFQELAALAVEMGEEHLPQRGRPIPPEMDALGEQAARHWLRTGLRPSLPEEKAAAFPRFWFANTFLRHAVLHQTRMALDLGRPAALPGVLMLELWEAKGRELWESPKPEFPWGG